MTNDTYTAAELRELLKRGEIDLPALEHAGLIGENELDLLLSIKQHHPERQNADIYDRVLERATSHRVREAVERDHLSAMAHAAGLSDSRIDASSFSFTDKVRELFKPQDRDHMLNLVIYAPPPPVGPTGVGKSDFGYTLIEGAELVYEGQIAVSSNNTTDPYDDVQSWTELEAWLAATDGAKVFLWDEAAQVLQFSDMSAGKALSQLIKLLRKHNCHLILVAHTGKDIPKDVRRMVLFAQKESKKKATIGAGLEEDQSGWMQIKNVMMRFNGIPEKSVEYDDKNDEGDFVFDNDDSDDLVDEDDTDPICAAETNAGNPCPGTAKYPPDDPQYCVNHRGLARSDDDDPDDEHTGDAVDEDTDTDDLDIESGTLDNVDADPGVSGVDSDAPADANEYLDRMAAALDEDRADVEDMVVDALMDAHSDNRDDADPDDGEAKDDD